jgi:hypothetical protein
MFMKNFLFLLKRAISCRAKNFTVGLLTLCALTGANYGADGQDCSTLSAGTIKNSDGYGTICAGTKPKVESVTYATGGSGDYSYQWQYRTNGNNNTWLDNEWKPIGSHVYGYAPDDTQMPFFYDTVQIRRAVYDNVCDEYKFSEPVIIIVNPMPTVSAIGNVTVCTGANVSIPVSGVATEYRWTADSNSDITGLSTTTASTAVSGAATLNLGTLTNTVATPQTITITVTPYYINTTACPGTPEKFTITVNPKPTVTVTGAPTEAVCHDAQIDNISISGTATKYHWEVTAGEYAALGLTVSSGDITGSSGTVAFNGNAVNAGNSPVTVEMEVTPYYTDGCPGTPEKFTITVNPEPKIEIPVTATQTVCSGTAVTGVTFETLITDPTMVDYSWEASGEWNKIAPLEIASSGVGNFNGFTAKANTSNEPYVATIKVTPKIGNCSGTAKTFTITVNPDMSGGTIAAAQTVCYNTVPDKLTSSVDASGGKGTTVYEWEYKTTENWTSIVSSNSKEYQPGALTETTTYRRKYSSGCGDIYSNEITVMVAPDIDGGIIAAAQTVCYNTVPDKLTSSVDASGGKGTTVYEWEYKTTGNWTPVGSSNGKEYQPGALTETTTYRRKYSSDCGDIYSNEITVTVAPMPVVNAVSDGTVCNGGTHAAINLSGTPSGDVAFSWTVANSVAAGLSSSGSGNQIIFGPAMNTGTSPIEAVITVTPKIASRPECTGATETFKITVNPTPTLSSTTAPPAICSGTAFSYTATSVTPGTTFTWTRAAVSGISEAAITDGTGATISETLTGTAATATDVIYKITLTANGCTNTQDVTVRVNALPDAPTANDVTVCYDGNEHVAGATVKTGEEVVWYASENGTETATAPKATTGSATAYAAAKNSATQCESYARTKVTVIVNALPDAPTANDVTVCYDGNEHVAGATAGAGETVVWYDALTGGSSATAPRQTSAGTTTVYAAARNADGCESETRTAVTVTVTRPATAGDIKLTGETTICSGSTTVLTAGSDVENAIYRWYSAPEATEPFHTGDVYTTPALTVATAYYISLAGDGVCENAADDRKKVEITLMPAPALNMNRHSGAIYSGTVFNISLETEIEGTHISWKRDLCEGIEQQSSTGASSEISEMLTNTANTPVEAKYAIIMTSPSGCTAGDTVSVTVNPDSAPPTLVEQPADTAYCVCAKGVLYKLAVEVETDGDAEFTYQWYSNTVQSHEGGTAVSGATGRVFYAPSGLPVGIYYYYCEVKSNYSPVPAYSKTASVTVEPDNASIGQLSVNSENIPVETVESGVLEYMAQCEEESIILDATPSSKYAAISVTVDGNKYEENIENLEIPLVSDVTEIKIRIETCDDKTVRNHTLIVTKAVQKLVFKRWDNSLAVYRNPANNGGYHDIRGVRWYKNDRLFEVQAEADMNAVADKNARREWFIHLQAGEPADLYRAEINIAGHWHRTCGEPVQSELVSNVRVYPNPVAAGENITVELPFVPSNGCMDITSLSGSTFKRNIPLNSIINHVDAGYLFPGIYILRITDAPDKMKQTVTSVKIIVK